MPFSHYALDVFVSQELSKLTSYSPRSLALEFPGRGQWLTQFVLRRIFHRHVPDEHAPLAFALLRRAEAALDEWELACQVSQQDIQRPSGYFTALRRFENSLAALWQALELGRQALGIKLFAKGDGSTFERLNWLYNKSRHFDPAKLPTGALHPLWLTDDGLHSDEQSVTFDEMRDALKMLGGVARDLVETDQHPSAPGVDKSPRQ